MQLKQLGGRGINFDREFCNSSQQAGFDLVHCKLLSMDSTV